MMRVVSLGALAAAVVLLASYAWKMGAYYAELQDQNVLFLRASRSATEDHLETREGALRARRVCEAGRCEALIGGDEGFTHFVSYPAADPLFVTYRDTRTLMPPSAENLFLTLFLLFASLLAELARVAFRRHERPSTRWLGWADGTGNVLVPTSGTLREGRVIHAVRPGWVWLTPETEVGAGDAYRADPRPAYRAAPTELATAMRRPWGRYVGRTAVVLLMGAYAFFVLLMMGPL